MWIVREAVRIIGIIIDVIRLGLKSSHDRPTLEVVRIIAKGLWRLLGLLVLLGYADLSLHATGQPRVW